MSQAEQEQKLQDAMTSLRALIAPGPVIEQVYQVCDALAARLDAEVGVRSSEGDKLRSLVELYEQYDENSIEYADQIVGLVKDRMKAELGDEAIKGFLQDLRPSEYPTEITGELRLRAEEVIRQLLRGQDEARAATIAMTNERNALGLERDEAMKSVRAFATWQCPFPDGEKGLTNDEHGNQYCAMEARVKELEAERNLAISGIDPMDCYPEIAALCKKYPPGEDEEDREWDRKKSGGML